MERATYEKKQVKFPAQGIELAGSSIQDRLSNAERPAKSSDDTAYGSDFHLPGCVAHQINGPFTARTVNRNPPFVNGNACRLKSDRVELPFFEELLQVMTCFRTRLPD